MSMTGFGRSTFQWEGQSFSIEAKSLNHRHLDVRVRLPWLQVKLESLMSAAVRNRVARGRVEIHLLEDVHGSNGAGRLALNRPLAQDLSQILGELGQILGVDGAAAACLIPPPRDLLLSGAASVDPEQLWESLEPALDSALNDLLQMRAQEGQAHQEVLSGHLRRLARLRDEVLVLAADEPQRQRRRLVQRLEKLHEETADLDPSRLAQEVALLADRCDISEELDRLQSHLPQMEDLLNSCEGPCGRKMEFLLQEFLREFNTIGSKTHNAGVTQAVVEAKGDLEKMRELALNVE